MIFSYNFFKSDKFILRYVTRIFLNKLNKANKLLNSNQFVILNQDYVSNDILIDG